MTDAHDDGGLKPGTAALDVDNFGTPPTTAELTTAAAIERGVGRLMAAYNIATLSELVLPDGRRADVTGLCADGRIVIVEIKSSVADLRADGKWPDYRAYCDQLYFAVESTFPLELLPPDTGIILADRHGGSFERDAPSHPIAPARRKAMTLRFARATASRLSRIRDPGIGTEGL